MASSTLCADVYVSQDYHLWFNELAATLIHCIKKAVLVDTPISIPQTEDLIQWIEDIMPKR